MAMTREVIMWTIHIEEPMLHDYLDMQAAVGTTKHLGGSGRFQIYLLDFATDELSELTLDGESRWPLAGW